MISAKINLSEENVKSAERVLDEFAKSVQNGVTVWSAKGLLMHVLMDLDLEVEK